MDTVPFVHIFQSELQGDLKALVQKMKGGAYKQDAMQE